MTAKSTESNDLESFILNPTHSTSLKLEKSLRKDKKNKKLKKLTFALGGNCNTEFLEPTIYNYFYSKKINSKFINLQFNNWESEVFKGNINADWWIIWISSMGLSRGGTERKKIDIKSIQKACDIIYSRGQKLLLILPEYLYLENIYNSSFSNWRKKTTTQLCQNINKETILVTLEKVMSNNKDIWHAPRYWSLAKIPCHPDSVAKVGIEVSRMIDLSIKRSIKAIAVDLDNTLWGGIVGDIGYENISIDVDGLGRPYLEMQRFLKDRIKLGIPVCIISKNNSNNAMDAFRYRKEMILKKKDILNFYISWEPKHNALKKMSVDLNIGLDSICFIDDSLFEQDQVRKILPEVIVLEMSRNPENRVRDLLDTGLFNFAATTIEDFNRVKMYKTEIKRKKIKDHSRNYDEYLKTIRMKLFIDKINSINISRVSSLLEKTNQFNLTNSKTCSQQIASQLKASNFYSVCGSLTDKLGDSGIIYVMLAEKKGDYIFIIDWVMSCRVFGRQVERASLNHLISWSKKKGAKKIKSKFIITQKNKDLLNTLKDLKFKIDKKNNIELDLHENYRYETPIDVND